MTREQAYQAMKDGKKITHSNFNSDEWYELYGNNVYKNGNFLICQAHDGINGWEADGWEIYQESVSDGRRGAGYAYGEFEDEATPEYPDTDRWNIEKL